MSSRGELGISVHISPISTSLSPGRDSSYHFEMRRIQPNSTPIGRQKWLLPDISVDDAAIA